MMAREGVNLDDPDAVKEYIAAKESSNGYKEALCDAYSRYLRYNGLTWWRPRYERDDQPPYVPTEEEINVLIAGAGKKYSLLLSLIRDTGMRPIEVERVRVRWLDLQRGSINVQTAKHGKGRTLELKPQTLAMLKEYIGTHDLGLNDRIFATVKTIRGEFRFWRAISTSETSVFRQRLRKVGLRLRSSRRCSVVFSQ